MAYPDHLLSRGETVVLHKHPHWKVLILPVLAFIVVVGGGSALAAWVTHWKDVGFTSHPQWFISISAVGLVLLVLLVLVPFLRWGTEHFVISTAHVFFRTGILRRREHQIPLSRIQNMETEVTFWGRLLGFGSLIVESAADQPLEFENVASLAKVQATLNQLISDDRGGPRAPESNDGMGGAGDRLPVSADADRTPPPAVGRRFTATPHHAAAAAAAAEEQYADQGRAAGSQERYPEQTNFDPAPTDGQTQMLGQQAPPVRNVHERRRRQ